MTKEKDEEKDVWIYSDGMDDIPYERLIDTLIEKCDEFQLMVPFQEDYDDQYGLTEQESEEILAHVYGEIMGDTRHIWNRLPEERKKELSSFEEFVGGIEAERKRLLSKYKTIDELIRHCQCDRRGIGCDVWHIYSMQDFYAQLEIQHTELRGLGKVRDILAELRVPENKMLLDNHIRSKMTHSWPLTRSSQLKIEHHFKCNPETAEWLKRKTGIFEFYNNVLDDLCFIKDGKGILCVCVHEGMASLNKAVFDS